MKNPLKNMLGKRDKSAAEIEAELEKLGRKLADHQRRRSELMQAAEEARAIWRESLAEDDDVIAAAKANVDRLEREAEEATRVITEYEGAIADAEGRFRSVSDTEQRAAAAARLEAIAKKTEAFAPELQKAVATLSTVMKRIRAALPDDIGIFEIEHDSRPGKRPERLNSFASSGEATAALLAEVMLAELPELFDVIDVGNREAIALIAVGDPAAKRLEVLSWQRRDDIGLSPAAAIDGLVSSHLRSRASRILAGEIDPGVDSVKIVEPYRAPPPPSEIRVTGLKNFKFLMGEPGYKPRSESVIEGSDAYLRAEIANAAISRGYAALHDSPEAIRRVEELRSRKGFVIGSTSNEDYNDLGDPLGLLRAYEAFKADRQVAAEEAARAIG